MVIVKLKESLIGELVLYTSDGRAAIVLVYAGKSCLRLVRDGRDELDNVRAYGETVEDYIREATLEWPDLVRAGASWTPKFA